MAISPQLMSQIRKAYHKLSLLEPKIVKAQACDIDCQEIERRRKAAMETLRKFNETYGPEHPER